jgi:hypothetical protein
MGKRNGRKLSLNKETVRSLSTGALKLVGGANGTSIFPQPSICLAGPCAPIPSFQSCPTVCDRCNEL